MRSLFRCRWTVLAITGTAMSMPAHARFLQVDPVGYDDQVNLYAYVGNDPINKTDPWGTYECNGSKTQCAAVAAAYDRASEALKSDNLSKSDRSKLQGTLTALGKPGEANGVNVGFASARDIRGATGGRSDVAYTERVGKNAINVRINNNYPTMYDAHKRVTYPGQNYRGLSPRDERSAIFVHEGRHVFQNTRGMTSQDYAKNPKPYEDDAYATGRLINRAYGSTPISQSEDD